MCFLRHIRPGPERRPYRAAGSDPARYRNAGRKTSPSAAGVVPILRNTLHAGEDQAFFVRRQMRVDVGIEDAFLLVIVRFQYAKNRLFLDIRFGIAGSHFAMQRIEPRLDLPVLHPHHGGRPGGPRAGLVLPPREENLRLPEDMPFQAEEKRFEGLFGLGEIFALHPPVALETFIKPVVVVFVVRLNTFLFHETPPPGVVVDERIAQVEADFFALEQVNLDNIFLRFPGDAGETPRVSDEDAPPAGADQAAPLPGRKNPADAVDGGPDDFRQILLGNRQFDFDATRT